jgi:hypothetical protein
MGLRGSGRPCAEVPALISEIERRPEAILFHDKMTTALTVPGAASRN